MDAKIDIINELSGAKKVGISGHVRPDGDCVCSCLALYTYIKKALPELDVTVYLEKPSDVFDFLVNRDKINSTFVGINNFDVYFALDSGDSKRLVGAEPFFMHAKKKICIDHHASNEGFGDISYVVPDASSTCEVLYNLFDKKYIDRDIAECIYTGIIHDTGVLQYSNTSNITFDVVMECKKFDIDTSKIITETFYQKTYTQNQILGRVLTESILLMDGKCIAGVVTKKLLSFYNATALDLEGIVNQLLYTKGVEVAIFVHEMKPDEYKVSLRSNGKVNVAGICLHFGGGGHVRAAGCALRGSVDDVLKNITEQIEYQLNSGGVI